MSMRIVIGLDGSPHAESALNMALRRAKRYGSTLIGVGVVDRPSIEQIEVGAYPGSLQLSQDAASKMLNDAKRRAEELIAAFRDVCTQHSVACEDIIHSGSAAEGLLEEGKTADLIITGLRTFFSFPATGQSDDTLRQLFQHPVCPVLAVPSNLELPRHVIIAYDGSPGAARALHAYVAATPELPEDIRVSLLCVSRDFERNKFHLEKADIYLRAHGITSDILVCRGTPTEIIISTAKELMPSLVILGAPYYRGIAERLFGSVTEAVIKDGSIPVFVYH